MYHDNRTTPHKESIRKPLTGFTHTYTPNDFEIIDDEVMEQLGRNMFSKSKNVATPNASKPNFFCNCKSLSVFDISYLEKVKKKVYDISMSFECTAFPDLKYP